MATPELTCNACHDGSIDWNTLTCSSCGHTLAVEDGVIMYSDIRNEDDYPEEMTDALVGVQDKHFWHTSRNLWLRACMIDIMRYNPHPTFLEMGCGTGFVTHAIEKLGVDAVGSDMYAYGLKLGATYTDSPLVSATIDQLAFRDNFDVVGLFDVIEHLDDDLAALRHATTYLKPGGHLLITVPAMQGLWSRFDEDQGHKRRYNRDKLLTVLQQAGFEPEHTTYLYSFALPMVALQRLVVQRTPKKKLHDYLRPPAAPINSILKQLAVLELRLHYALGKRAYPFGTSLLCVAKMKG